jgi:hypothetical protein
MATSPSNNILFLDIETVSQQAAYNSLDPDWQQLWNRKANQLTRNKEEETPESIYSRAAIYAEFGKIVCISCGLLQGNTTAKNLVLKSFFGDDEHKVLQDFADMLNKWDNENNKYLCAHNGKEFDFPYICRRMIVHQIPLPSILHLAGKKPWEVNHLDTMELWKFGDYKSFTSLSLLAATLGVPTPKDDIDGSMVGDVYWKEKNLDRIVTYCQKDVITVAQLYLKMNAEPLIKQENIEIRP